MQDQAANIEALASALQAKSESNEAVHWSYDNDPHVNEVAAAVKWTLYVAMKGLKKISFDDLSANELGLFLAMLYLIKGCFTVVLEKDRDLDEMLRKVNG